MPNGRKSGVKFPDPTTTKANAGTTSSTATTRRAGGSSTDSAKTLQDMCRLLRDAGIPIGDYTLIEEELARNVSAD